MDLSVSAGGQPTGRQPLGTEVLPEILPRPVKWMRTRSWPGVASVFGPITATDTRADFRDWNARHAFCCVSVPKTRPTPVGAGRLTPHLPCNVVAAPRVAVPTRPVNVPSHCPCPRGVRRSGGWSGYVDAFLPVPECPSPSCPDRRLRTLPRFRLCRWTSKKTRRNPPGVCVSCPVDRTRTHRRAVAWRDSDVFLGGGIRYRRLLGNAGVMPFSVFQHARGVNQREVNTGNFAGPNRGLVLNAGVCFAFGD